MLSGMSDSVHLLTLTVCCVCDIGIVTDLCDDLDMRAAVLTLLDEIQHKHLEDLHSGTASAERHSSSLRR